MLIMNIHLEFQKAMFNHVLNISYSSQIGPIFRTGIHSTRNQLCTTRGERKIISFQCQKECFEKKLSFLAE